MADHRDFALRLKNACDRSQEVPEFGKGQQTWISERLGVSQEAVRRYFEGQSRPRPALMTKLAKLLGVDEAWLALGASSDMTEKERRQYTEKAEAAAYMIFGIFMAAGYSCAFADDEPAIDFFAIKSGKQIAVSVTAAYSKSKGNYVARVKDNCIRHLNLCVVSDEPGAFDVLVMDKDGVEEFGEATTDTIQVPIKKEPQGYHTKGRVWTQLKDSGIL